MKHQSCNRSLLIPHKSICLFQRRQAVEYSHCQLDLAQIWNTHPLWPQPGWGPKMTSDRYNGILEFIHSKTATFITSHGTVKRNNKHVQSLQLYLYVTRFSLFNIKTCCWLGKSTFHSSLSISRYYSSVTKITCYSVFPFP